jgi:spermidine/putrescine transport system substrate-binding protein
MSESRHRGIEDARFNELMRRRLTRRSVLRGTGVGVAGFSLASFLAACGGGDGGGTGGGGGGNGNGGNGGNGNGGNGGPDVGDIYAGEAGDTVSFANWPFYMDQSKDDQGQVYNPSLAMFTEQTGINVNYQDVINSNEEFFGRLRPQLAAGDSTGWDIMVITNGRYFTALTLNKWVYPLDPSRRPNFDANATSWARDPFFDPGNQYGMCWQSGIDGIAYNTDLVSEPITKLDDLANPDKVGTSQVGMLEYDMPDFVMINLGIDPETSGPDEWREAAAWLQMQKESGTVRNYYGNDYLDELRNGNLSATMAWSGDVMYSNIWLGYENLIFEFPEGGALIWIDNMMIPAASENPVGAMQLMDFYFDPEPATMLQEWVLFMSPVAATQDLMLRHADEAQDEGLRGRANKLRATAESPFLFPTDEFLERTSFGFSDWTDEAVEEWDSIFLPISQG